MSKVFERTEINGMILENRLVRSATWEGMCAPDGGATERLTDCYRELARGGVGLIITGYAFVSPEGRQMPCKMGLHSDALADGMKNMTDAVHKEGGRICAQLVHAGGQTNEKAIGQTPIAPSAVAAAQFQGVTPKAMDKADIARVTEAFAQAARRAKSWGFDAVELHAAHGYLISQFLSPLTNQRTDEYGGSIENRARFLMEVYGAVRSAVGGGYPVMAKLNGSDNMEGGMSAADAVYAAVALSKAGIDAIEVSGGTPASGGEGPVRTKINSPEREAYNLQAALAIKNSVSCPVMSVGGFRTLDVIEEAIGSGIDYVSLSRPLIREPQLPAIWQRGERAAARCISCNKCFLAAIKEGGIYCVADKNEKTPKP